MRQQIKNGDDKMIRFVVKQWDKNKDKLEEHFKESLFLYESCDYTRLVEAVIRFIYNDNPKAEDYPYRKFDARGITCIDNGDYQGTMLFMIPRDTYQPSAREYLLTHVSYGSCSGCDTLLNVQYTIEKVVDKYGYEDLTEKEKQEYKDSAVKDLMSLSLHLVQNTIKPYNKGWERDEDFDEIGYSSQEDSDNDKKDDPDLGLIF